MALRRSDTASSGLPFDNAACACVMRSSTALLDCACAAVDRSVAKQTADRNPTTLDAQERDMATPLRLLLFNVWTPDEPGHPHYAPGATTVGGCAMGRNV